MAAMVSEGLSPLGALICPIDVCMIFLWWAALMQFSVHLLSSDSFRDMSPFVALADVLSFLIRGSSSGWSSSNMFVICVRFDIDIV